MSRDHAVMAIAPTPGTKQNDRWQCDPAAHGMHHYRSGEIMEFRTKSAQQPVLQPQIAVPGQPFEKWIDEPHQDEGRNAVAG